MSGAAGELVSSYATALAAVKLGASGFGAMAATQAFMKPFQSLAIFGLSVVSMTLAARRGGCDARLMGTLSVLHLILCAIAAVLCLSAAVVTGRWGIVPLLLVLTINLALIPVSAPSNLPLQYDQAMHRVIAVPAVTGLIRLGLAYAAVSYENTPIGHQLAATVAGASGTLITWRLSQRFYPRRWQFDGALARELLALAWPAAVLKVVVMVYSRAAYLFLESAGQRVQGEFAAADRLSRPVLVLAGALVSSSMPSVAKRARRDGRSQAALGRLREGAQPVSARAHPGGGAFGVGGALAAPALRARVPERRAAVSGALDRGHVHVPEPALVDVPRRDGPVPADHGGRDGEPGRLRRAGVVLGSTLCRGGRGAVDDRDGGSNCAQQFAILAFVLRASGEPQKGSRS